VYRRSIVDTIGTALKAFFVVAMAVNLLAWQHLVLGFDTRSIRMVNPIEIVVAILASITIYRALYAFLNDTLFPAMDRVFDAMREKREDRVACPCGRRHNI
jgi:hypothetical protein